MKILAKTLFVMFLCISSVALYAAYIGRASASEKMAMPGFVPSDSKLLLVFANAGEGKEAEFDTYYDQHMKDIASLPNFVRVQRFKVSIRDAKKPDPQYKWLFVWEFKGDQNESFARLQQWIKDGKIGSAGPGVVAKLDGMNYAADGAGYLGTLAKK